MGLPTFVAASLFALRLLSTTAQATSSPSGLDSSTSATASSWWMSTIQHQGKPAFGNDSSYTVFRDVMKFGAKGNGVADDTNAINEAIKSGFRCGGGKTCDSSTTTPAIVYFPPGTYKVSEPLELYYYTQLIGDANNLPILKPSRNFLGIAVLDSNPYVNDKQGWFTQQNNFFRQIRNFKFDLTDGPDAATGIHWRVAQATSLQNLDFQMRRFDGPDSADGQQGIFMEDGSGGFMTDLFFTGGKLGMYLGNQQFTTRSLEFRDCRTAIYMRWNWLWTFHGVSIHNCDTGIDMSTKDLDSKDLGSIVLVDSTISNTKTGIKTRDTSQQPGTNGTLILDNVDFSKVGAAIQDPINNQTLLEGGFLVKSWVRGRSYKGSEGSTVRNDTSYVPRPPALLDGTGRFVTKSKPQYRNVPASKFVSVKARGAKGDGATDDTVNIQKVFDNIKADEIVHFDHGAYLVTDTVRVPKDVKVVGEIWPLIMAGGKSFQDEKNPKPVFQIGQPGDRGDVEIQDLMFETQGPQPGAILVEFNVAGKTSGSAGLFDVHFRIGGSNGTRLQSDTCGNRTQTSPVPNPDCFGAFMLLHVTPTASPYIENSWLWVADHELDKPPYEQVTIYNARGALIESTQGAWLWGTSSEHNVLSNYQLNNARNVFMGFIQTETAYFQGRPDASQPFKSNKKYADPDFSSCSSSSNCARTWGLRVQNSKDVVLYGGGLYSFFDAYEQSCVDKNNCQENIISVDNSNVRLIGVSTKASVNMITLDGKPAALDSDNRAEFCATIARFETKGYKELGSTGNMSSADGTSQQPSAPSASAAGTLGGAVSTLRPSDQGSSSSSTHGGTAQAQPNDGATGQSSGSPADSAQGVNKGASSAASAVPSARLSGQTSASGQNSLPQGNVGADGSPSVIGASSPGGEPSSSTSPNVAQRPIRPNCLKKRAARRKRTVSP